MRGSADSVCDHRDGAENGFDLVSHIAEKGRIMTERTSPVVLVTGAGSGIGQATAILFARNGARVIVSDHHEGGGLKTLEAIRAVGGDAIFVRADVARSEDVRALMEQIDQTYGRLDYAFNNAGIEGEQAKTADCTEENWNRVLGVNLTGVFLCMKYELPLMLRQGSGSIVNCSSVAGLGGFVGIPAYDASKHGIIGLTKTAALEYASDGIRINAVCPGVIDTPMVHRFTGERAEAQAGMIKMEPLGRLGRPEEIAAAVVWLCSDAASFVTGIAMPVDGGYAAP
jgi:NAD(P)-dependent dehydrogenase (short-subunit alcohol dehydrogenase family)